MTNLALTPVTDRETRERIVAEAVRLVQPLLFGADAETLAFNLRLALEVVGPFYAAQSTVADLLDSEVADMRAPSARTLRETEARKVVIGAALGAALNWAREQQA